MGIILLPERYSVNLPALEKGRRERTKPRPLVAAGTHVDSNISLYHLFCECRQQASVFLYPSTIALFPSRISEIEPRFIDVHHIKTRTLKDSSPDDIYRRLLAAVHPTQSFMDNRYTFSNAQINEHSFDIDSSASLTEAIINLESKTEKTSFEKDPYWWKNKEEY